jgi:hypothetical protein
MGGCLVKSKNVIFEVSTPVATKITIFTISKLKLEASGFPSTYLHNSWHHKPHDCNLYEKCVRDVHPLKSHCFFFIFSFHMCTK